jgi:acyl-CoA thioesterase-1
MKTALLLISAFFLAHAHAQQPSIDAVVKNLESGARPVRVVCFGDSITGVYYHTGSRRAWTDLLGIALKKAWPAAQVEMINAGISGNTTTAALARIDRDVLAKKPDLVAVMFGMNDVVRIPPQEYERNLTTIADRCAQAGAAVVFCTPNSVVENPQRSNAKLAAYAAIMKRVAATRGWPVADAFANYDALAKSDPARWTLLMSESIHPNLNGHRRFAELIASALAGREIEITDADAPPAPDPLAITLGKIKASQPVKIVAMPPYDKIVPEIIQARHPDAKIEVIPWPMGAPWIEEGRTASKGLAKTIRDLHPTLVVIAPGAAMLNQPDAAGFLGDCRWVLNFAFPFATREWDVLAVMPTQAANDPNRTAILRAMIAGTDLAPIEGDARKAIEALFEPGR